MITIQVKGDLKKTTSFLERALEVFNLGILDKYGRRGVDVLSAATPKDSGVTADSWYYRISRRKNGVAIEWLNSSQNEGIPIVILLQYGHGFDGGGYYEGLDFINPAMRPLFDEITEEAWKELTNE